MSKLKSIDHERMVVAIVQAAERLNLKIGCLLRQHDLTHVQYNILRILRGAMPEKLGVGQVKERVIFSNADVSRLLDRLVAKELANREMCKHDRRKVDVFISKKGMEILEKLDEEMMTSLDSYFESRVSKDEARYLTEQLNKLV